MRSTSSLRSLRTPSFSRFLVAAAFAAGLCGCPSSPFGGVIPKTDPEGFVILPYESACSSAGAIAEIGPSYALDANDPRAVWVDSTGMVLNLANVNGAASWLVAGAPWYGMENAEFSAYSGTIVFAGATASTIYYANMLGGLDAPLIEWAPRGGGHATMLGTADSSMTSIALGPSALYEATLSGISSMPTTGGSMTQIHGGGSALDLLVTNDGANLYWVTGDLLGPYYVRTSPLDGPFTASTVATMPTYTSVSSMVVANGEVLIVGTTYPLDPSGNPPPTYANSLFTVSTSGGTPTLIDTAPLGDAATPPKPRLALAKGAAYYSLDGTLKKVALDGSNATSTVSVTTSIDGIGADPSGGDVVYVTGKCVHAIHGS
jgi:hypothetical protein